MLITRDHILNALLEIDASPTPMRRSLGYDVVYRGRHYPPIQVMRIAYRLATGMDAWPLPGGPQTNKFLEEAGFTVVSKKKLALLRNPPLDAATLPPGGDEEPVSPVIEPHRTFTPPAPLSVVAEPEADPVPAGWDGDPVLFAQATADLFLPPARVAELLDVVRRRRTLVLQGPPGTGKSLLARRLAALLHHADPTADRTEPLQLHPGYAYEEFILGYRPAPGGGFTLQEGLLLRLARRAQADATRPYVLLLDELNRAPLGSVLGEALSLLPAEARGRQHAVRLPAASPTAPPLWLPPNLYVIGTMNTADRALTPLDFALRRRLAFATLEPEFGDRFRAWLTGRGAPAALVTALAEALLALNEQLAADPALGPGFRIGHSYFTTPRPPDGDWPTWYRRILDYDLAPLLAELFLEDPAAVQRHVRALRAVVSPA